MEKNVISNEQLYEQLTKAVADAQAAATSAQASSSAAGSAINARTQSNTEQASGTEAILKSVHTDSDIGIPEAWSANVKRTYDVHQSYDLDGQVRNRTHFDNSIIAMQTHIANLNQMSIQALANNQNQSNLANTLAIDRSWNINETDAFAVLLNKVVGEAVREAINK